MFIFHKTEVQTVILRWWMGLNFDCFKSYGLRCSLRPRASSANSQKIATDKWPCNDHTWPFFTNNIFIFHKTEIQTVILRCLMSLNLNWIKGYNIKYKKSHFLFLQFCKEKAWKFTTQKWPFYDPSWPFFCQLHQNLSKNWDSNGHFEVHSGSESQLDQKLGHYISSK